MKIQANNFLKIQDLGWSLLMGFLCRKQNWEKARIFWAPFGRSKKIILVLIDEQPSESFKAYREILPVLPTIINNRQNDKWINEHMKENTDNMQKGR